MYMQNKCFSYVLSDLLIDQQGLTFLAHPVYYMHIIYRAVPNIRFEFKPDRIVGQMDYSYSTEYCHDLEPEYG